MNKVKEFFQKPGQAVLWIKESFQKCRQVVLCVPVFFQKYGQAILWFILVFLFIFFISVMFFNCAESLFGNLLGTSESKQETLKFIGFAMGGILAALGAIAVNRRADAQVENNKLIEIEHIDERFKAAVEHLGNKETRIAAWDEFYSLADQHEKLRKKIFNILCGKLREITISEDYKKTYPDKPSETIQTLLDVLFKSKGKNAFDNLPANLRQTYLVGADLGEANLQNATFLEANLQSANLQSADLQKAKFWEGDLQGTDFRRADLQNANFMEVDLRKAKFSEANLQKAKFWEGDLQDVDLQNTNLQNVTFFSYRLQNAKFFHADLRKAEFSGANLEDASFWNADLQDAKFSVREFPGVGFSKTNLQSTNFSGAKNMTSEMIELAIIDDNTKLPEGVTHPSRKKSPIAPVTTPSNPV